MAGFTIQQAFELALQHHQAGRLGDAEQIYRQILPQCPDHPSVLHNLGLVLLQTGRNDGAAELFRRTIQINPALAEAHCNLGLALQGTRQLDDAIAAYRQSIILRPGYAESLYNLANALRDKGQLDDAISSYRQAIAVRPGYAEAWYNLGTTLKDRGQLDEAIAAYRQAIAFRPGYDKAHCNLGNALKDKGQLDEAIASYQQAIAVSPSYAEAFDNLGNALQDRGQFDNAIAAHREAIALRPNHAHAHYNLGIALEAKGLSAEAIASYQHAIALQPALVDAHNNLGNVLKDRGQLDEAVAAYQQAIALRPGFAEAHNNLASALKDKGQLDDAIAAIRCALTLRPSYAEAHSNLLLDLNYHPGFDARAIAAELSRWNHQHAEPLRKFIQPHTNDRGPDRRLRIGYVSADFWWHASAFFLLPLLEHHDPQHVEIICYAQDLRPDATTSRMQQHVSKWHNTMNLSDEQLAAQIRMDRIDILVDLKLHTGSNRLLVFARKPAPVQATWLGYPGSTGLDTIDYRLSDPYLDPPGMDESVYAEQTLRLPDTFWCYDPLDGREIPVNSLPALDAGTITFGSLNAFCKINPGVLELWAQVLRQVDGSRLILLANSGSHRQRTAEFLAQQGVDPNRLEFLDRRSRPEYLKLYHRIDLGLDTFPANGHTTSLDSFWMGVPVVTLVGQTAVARAGWSQLSNLGLTELAAKTPDQFVSLAVGLARDIPRLKELRSTLRKRMEESPLMNAPRFAANIEAAYRQMWRGWCARITDDDRQCCK